MNATFEKRLNTKPVKSRLGRNLPVRRVGQADLRQKLTKGSRPGDARSVLRKRVQTTVRPKRIIRDARRLLQRRLRPIVRAPQRRLPLVIPTKTVRNELFSRGRASRIAGTGRRPLRRYAPSHIPDLLSLPTIAPASFLQTSAAAGRLFTTISNPMEALASIPVTGTKVSPIQGFRVEIRNLQPSVTLDDVFELFSSIGTLRLCNLIRPGHAEVVFNEASDAREAVRRYNNRELDGRPMNVALITQVPDSPAGGSPSSRIASRLGPSHGGFNTRASGQWQQRNAGGAQSGPRMEVDMDVVRKALFHVNAGASGPRGPVDFNVSLR
ncbi:hypothetical protein T265_07692 [Opisthorchis viverrini]|uniref:RRM domain-containing protein n=1 Tax=Opisthorchis viverrini TaxID=6198 RepID=A0A075AAW1_OPIVI|nr:hypothetical protein T265_07692 [Opisthorchis viverrini]KER24689.1 hypothetical protein T265_07692 [Opisthorchis viverrini]